MANENQNGWNEYSKLVIAELERLNDGIIVLNSEIQGIKQEITELKTKEKTMESGVVEIKKWKDELNEVISPTQLKEAISDINLLRTFKTQAITIWAVVNILIGSLIAILKLF